MDKVPAKGVLGVKWEMVLWQLERHRKSMIYDVIMVVVVRGFVKSTYSARMKPTTYSPKSKKPSRRPSALDTRFGRRSTGDGLLSTDIEEMVRGPNRGK